METKQELKGFLVFSPLFEPFLLCNASKNGKHRSIDFEMEQIRPTIYFIRLCTSFGLERALILKISFIFSRMTLIPNWLTM